MSLHDRVFTEAEIPRRTSMSDILKRAKPARPQQIARRRPGAPTPKPPANTRWVNSRDAARNERERYTPAEHRAAVSAWEKKQAAAPHELGGIRPHRMGSPSDPGGLRRRGSVRG